MSYLVFLNTDCITLLFCMFFIQQGNDFATHSGSSSLIRQLVRGYCVHHFCLVSADVTETAPTGGNVGDVYVGASVNIPSYHVSKQISSQEKSTKMLRGYTPFVYSSVPG